MMLRLLIIVILFTARYQSLAQFYRYASLNSYEGVVLNDSLQFKPHVPHKKFVRVISNVFESYTTLTLHEENAIRQHLLIHLYHNYRDVLYKLALHNDRVTVHTSLLYFSATQADSMRKLDASINIFYTNPDSSDVELIWVNDFVLPKHIRTKVDMVTYRKAEAILLYNSETAELVR
ncbi:MAG: hypothetical protein ACK4HE_05160 [Chitinophagaceae bacterium]